MSIELTLECITARWNESPLPTVWMADPSSSTFGTIEGINAQIAGIIGDTGIIYVAYANVDMVDGVVIRSEAVSKI